MKAKAHILTPQSSLACAAGEMVQSLRPGAALWKSQVNPFPAQTGSPQSPVILAPENLITSGHGKHCTRIHTHTSIDTYIYVN